MWRLSFFTLFRGDQDDPVCSPGAVDGCRRSVFQHRDVLDIAGVQKVERIPPSIEAIVFDRHPVNHKERLIACGGGGAAPNVGWMRRRRVRRCSV